MQRLVTFGDSYTFGQGLDGTNIAHRHPHPDAWPEHLGKMLGVDTVINMSCPGSSNKQIWLTALNFEFQQGDIVVFCWSCNQRWLQIRKIKNIKQAIQPLLGAEPPQLRQYGTWMEQHPEIMEYYMHHWTALDALHEFCSKVDHVNQYVTDIAGDTVFHCAVPGVLDIGQLTDPPRYTQGRLKFDFVHDAQDDNDTELDLIDACLFGRPHWFNAPVLATMDPEIIQFGKTPDGHLAAEGHPVFAGRLLDLMLKQQPKLLD